MRPDAPDPNGLADSQFNYAIDKNFEVPYSYTWSFGMQRELPGNFPQNRFTVGWQGFEGIARASAQPPLRTVGGERNHPSVISDRLEAGFFADHSSLCQPWLVRSRINGGKAGGGGADHGLVPETAEAGLEDPVAAALGKAIEVCFGLQWVAFRSGQAPF